MLSEGIYILEEISQPGVLTQNVRSSDHSKIVYAPLNASEVQAAAFHIYIPDGYTTYKIKNIKTQTFLEYHNGSLRLGNDNGIGKRYRWRFQQRYV
jgi:hypothetical protein